MLQRMVQHHKIVLLFDFRQCLFFDADSVGIMYISFNKGIYALNIPEAGTTHFQYGGTGTATNIQNT